MKQVYKAISYEQILFTFKKLLKFAKMFPQELISANESKRFFLRAFNFANWRPILEIRENFWHL